MAGRESASVCAVSGATCAVTSAQKPIKRSGCGTMVLYARRTMRLAPSMVARSCAQGKRSGRAAGAEES
eukprot:1737506-Pleurochrysis_carterae.AAC.3